MSKEDREYFRRLKKMKKHVAALGGLVKDERKRNVLDEIAEGLALLEDRHPSQVDTVAGRG